MKLADVRFVKGMLFGIFAQVEDTPLLAVLLGLCALAYTLASIFTKESAAHPAQGEG